MTSRGRRYNKSGHLVKITQKKMSFIHTRGLFMFKIRASTPHLPLIPLGKREALTTGCLTPKGGADESRQVC